MLNFRGFGGFVNITSFRGFVVGRERFGGLTGYGKSRTQIAKGFNFELYGCFRK